MGNQDPIHRRLEELREFHIYPSYRTTSDEVWGNNPICSCGLHECDVAQLIGMLPTTPLDSLSVGERLRDA